MELEVWVSEKFHEWDEHPHQRIVVRDIPKRFVTQDHYVFDMSEGQKPDPDAAKAYADLLNSREVNHD